MSAPPLLFALLLAQGAAVPAGLVSLDSDEGQALFFEATDKRAFFGLAEHFVTQQSQSFCAVASAVVALNAAQAPAPEGPYMPYREWTQENVFTGPARLIKTPEQVSRGGMTLEELSRFLAAQPVESRAVPASATSLEEFRKIAAQALAQPRHAVLANFLRSKLGQEPSGLIEREAAGHWSPLGAYDQKSDRFLLLDVARYKYPPVWVPASDLFAAMQTTDLASGSSRGFIVLGPGTGKSSQPVQGRNLGLPLLLGLCAVLFGLGFLVGRSSKS